jgi:hypothetical protein
MFNYGHEWSNVFGSKISLVEVWNQGPRYVYMSFDADVFLNSIEPAIWQLVA